MSSRISKVLLVFILALQLNFVFIPLANSASETKSTQNEYWPSRLRFSAGGGTEGRGIFYIDELFPLYFTKDQATLWFLNLKENWQTPNAQEYNIGTGLRHIFNDKFIVGVHYFFDKKLSHNDIWHNQNGWGIEFLSQPFDFRFNYYDPRDKNEGSVVSNFYKLGAMHLLQIGPEEEALGGYDFEFGVPVFEKQTKTRLYIGGFFFDSKLGKDENGFRVRTETNLLKWLALDTTYNHSGSSKDEFIGGIRVTIPLELGRVLDKKNPLKTQDMDYIHDRLFERVVRDIDVKVKTTGIGDVVKEVPDVEIVYVDNTNNTGVEDGTLVHPYNTLDKALTDATGRYIGTGGTARYVYIFYGDGTSQGLDTGNYTLVDNAVLWGSGYNGGYNGIPVLGYPVIDDLASNIIVLANNNTVMGLEITDGTNGIYGSNISGATITHNIITGNFGNGIYLENYGVNSGWNITANTITLNSGSGIYLYNGADSVGEPLLSNVNISGNEITWNGGHGIYMENYIPASNINISGNDISWNGMLNSGIHINNYSDASNFSITGNTIYRNAGSGIYVYNGRDAQNFSISGNSITYNTGPGISLENYGYASDFNISGNTISNNESYRSGIHIDNYGDASDFSITGNIITGNGGDGIYLYNYNYGSASGFSISGNTIAGNYGNGISIYNGYYYYYPFLKADGVDSLNRGVSNFSITGNIISGNYGSGILLDNYYGYMSGFDISRNTITGNRSPTSGIDIHNSGGYASDFAISDNTITGNSGSGIDIYNQWGEMENFTFTLNRISENSGNGISINNYQAGMYNFSFLLNTITNNGLPIIEDGLDGFGPRKLGGNGFSLNNFEGEAGDFSFSLNNISNNTGLGLYFGTTESDTYNIDLGGGSLGSLGLNIIQGNQGEYDLVNDTNETIYAKNNFGLTADRIFGDVVH